MKSPNIPQSLAFWRTASLIALLCLAPACVDSNTGNDGKVTDGVDAGAADNGGVVPGPTVDCGNAICDDGESFFNCRNDCKAPEYVACYVENCKNEWDRCLDDQDCTGTMHCIELCDGDKACQEGCYFAAPDEAQAIVDSLLTCGNDNDSTQAGPPLAQGLDQIRARESVASTLKVPLASAKKTVRFSETAAKAMKLCARAQIHAATESAKTARTRTTVPMTAALSPSIPWSNASLTPVRTKLLRAKQIRPAPLYSIAWTNARKTTKDASLDASNKGDSIRP